MSAPAADDDITLRQLQVLLAFMETGNLARAAERLQTSVVSVHRALHALEEAMRCVLFRQEGRNLVPTPAAQRLAETAREMRRLLGDGVRATREIAGYAADRVRIGSMYSLTSRAVPALVLGMKQRRPTVQTELLLGSNADLLAKLRDGAIDAALMAVPVAATDIEYEPMFEDEAFFAAPAQSAYAAMPEVDLSACVDERFVSLTEGFATYDSFVEAFRIAGFAPQIAMHTGDIFSLMNLVDGSVGCTLLPGRMRTVLPPNVRLVPLLARYRVRQTIALSFLRSRERDPNLLALLAVCRASRGRF
ncbi:LysR family transcriptional regulator [Pseudorhodoferax soli]|uniref:LysR family malonate utilization transcriptional regulator n=1 Tax=Pseudorhodoferax soli TaxID=545864 RepID=A0A368XHL7_9BURK|nr:LysR family transcriptional regulator [Pseudorhodoferax soli]RCW66676.1 LysR family malonate utilization transcriptional regulator [Pseudorhodoferax soli]